MRPDSYEAYLRRTAYDPYSETYTIGARDVMMGRRVRSGWPVFLLGVVAGLAIGALLVLVATA
jgi:hypothetical protein